MSNDRILLDSILICFAGNTGSVPGKFPSLCLQDGPLGLRFADHATAWPAGLTAGATWNKELMFVPPKPHSLCFYASKLTRYQGETWRAPRSRGPSQGRSYHPRPCHGSSRPHASRWAQLGGVRIRSVPTGCRCGRNDQGHPRPGRDCHCKALHWYIPPLPMGNAEVSRMGADVTT